MATKHPDATSKQLSEDAPMSPGASARRQRGPAAHARHAAKDGPGGTMPWTRTVHGAAMVARPVAEAAPDLFDVISYFRARGDSFVRIANIGFERDDDPGKVWSAPALKTWYEAEAQRRAPPRPVPAAGKHR